LKRLLDEADTDLSKPNSWRMVVVMVMVFTASWFILNFEPPSGLW
jgi:hypothetical protein